MQYILSVQLYYQSIYLLIRIYLQHYFIAGFQVVFTKFY